MISSRTLIRGLRGNNLKGNKIGYRFSSTGLTKPELKDKAAAKQAPNREDVWTPSQASREGVISTHPYRFVQRDLNLQPQPYAAIELIAQEPVRYLKPEHGSVAVCDGNRGNLSQGHPKIYINIDQPKASACGYCGLRYAKEEHKHIIEGNGKKEL